MAELDWGNLGFEVRNTNAIIVSHFRDGKWSKPEVVNDLNITLHVYAGVFHYSNSCFEGLKAFRGADGKVRLFRPDENAKRMVRSAEFLDMPCPGEELFIEMCLMCVKENIDFLPPYGYNASMYLRPALIGSNPQLNLLSSTEADFIVMGNPVGLYAGGVPISGVPAVISRDFDRAAPNGTGSLKLSANYAASFHSYNVAKKMGFKELLFLDPATKTKVDEFGSSNFLGIKGDRYVTPLSPSVLPSITNKSLQTLAGDIGLTVEKRIVPVEELAEFEEVAACGTAVVITPIASITDKPALRSNEITKVYEYCQKGECGATCARLYHLLRGIQDGTETDIHNWCIEL